MNDRRDPQRRASARLQRYSLVRRLSDSKYQDGISDIVRE